jgi:hypothetical protein
VGDQEYEDLDTDANLQLRKERLIDDSIPIILPEIGHNSWQKLPDLLSPKDLTDCQKLALLCARSVYCFVRKILENIDLTAFL